MKPTLSARKLRPASIAIMAALGLLAAHPALGQETPAAPAVSSPTPTAAAPSAAPETQPAAPPSSTAEAEPVPPPMPSQPFIPAPPPSPASPPGYGPPPGTPYHHYYGYPSHGYRPYSGYGYSGYGLAAARPVTYRPFMFGVGMGLGSLALSSTSDSENAAALAYSVHLGFSITARWMVMLAMDGSWGQFTSDSPTGYAYGSRTVKKSVSLTTYTAGAQFFMLRWLYARAGLGVGCLEWNDSSAYSDGYSCRGQTATGAVGAEFLQTSSTSLAAEFGGFVSRFPDARVASDRNDVWYHLGVNLVLNLF